MNKNVFIFSGQGSQYHQMGVELYRNNKIFKKWMDKLDRTAKEFIGSSVVDMIYDKNRKKGDEFARTLYTHPAIFMVEYSLAMTLIDAGIIPDYVLGASLGEFVSLAVAEVMPAVNILELLLQQARSFEEKCKPGSMVAIIDDCNLYEKDIFINENCSMAGINYDRHFVVSGFSRNLLDIQEYLNKKGILFQRLPVSYGFHSPNMDPAFERFYKFCKIRVNTPTVEVVSSMSGRKQTLFDSRYFWDVVRKPIVFRDALKSLTGNGNFNYNLIDVGPAGTYAGFTKYNNVPGEDSRIFQIMTPFGTEEDNLKRLKHEIKLTPANKNLRKYKMRAYVFPGQGTQKKGMGKELFDEYSEYTEKADNILGYSIRDLCLNDPADNLKNTEYTQPALFVVNALSYLKKRDEGCEKPDFVAGHSLGEYSALFVGGVIDFETGLRLVKKRGELMAKAKNGRMAAVIGMDEESIRETLMVNGFRNINFANLNSPSQIVISGSGSEILDAKPVFEKAGCMKYVILNVSGAFHSNLMEDAKKEFSEFLHGFEYSKPVIPVISNYLARPYRHDNVKELLSEQITGSVKWTESVCYMWGKGVEEFTQIGPGRVLTGLIRSIQREAEPLTIAETEEIMPPAPDSEIKVESLGCSEFKNDYNLKYPYVAGAMANGIASKEMVIKMARAGMLSYFGTGGMALSDIERAILSIQDELRDEATYGMNLLSGPMENETVDLYLKHGVGNIEASAFMQMTPALVKFRLKGLKRDPAGSVRISNRIMGKLSRPEVAAVFLSPPPDTIVKKLLQEGAVTNEEAELAKNIPMADDICVESDSGGHTDMGVSTALLPTIIKLASDMMEKYRYPKKIRVGAAGGIGTPEAAASAFILGADFILTGSINQCTVEAGTSDVVKGMLQDINVQDTDYAPAGDMFEMGSKVQVLKRGVFFPARANKLYELYRHYDCLEDIDEKTRKQLQERYFKRSFDDIYEDCKKFFPAKEIERSERNPKQKMAFVFRWYFGYSSRLALQGFDENRVDFQVHCGPALGSFNQWIKGTGLEKWQNRHVDQIAEKIMLETAELLNDRLKALLI